MTPVAVNARYTSLPVTGMERFAREVVARMPGARLIAPSGHLRGAVGYAWEQGVLPLRLQKGETLWSPANVGPIAVKKHVVTLHDAAVFDHPEWFSPRVRVAYAALVPLLSRRVAVMMTDSSFSRDRIASHFPILEERLRVVRPGANASPASVPSYLERRATGPNGFVLAVGTLEPRKGVDRLLRAWPIIRNACPWLELKLVGGRSSLFQEIAELPTLEGVEFVGRVDDSALVELYRTAMLVVYPSRYEGFGLPVLEAMTGGAPVVASDIEVFRECFGSAAILVDADIADKLADAVVSLACDERLWTSCRAAGDRLVCERTWDDCASEVMGVISSV